MLELTEEQMKLIDKIQNIFISKMQKLNRVFIYCVFDEVQEITSETINELEQIKPRLELIDLKNKADLTAKKIVRAQGSPRYLKKKLRQQIVMIQKMVLKILLAKNWIDLPDFLELIAGMRIFESFIGVYKFRLKRIDLSEIPLPKELNGLPKQIHL